MKNFNQFAEAVMIATAKPEADSAGTISGGYECPSCGGQEDGGQPIDMFTQSTDDVLDNLGDVVQPDDNIGEIGDIESGSEEDSDVQIECTEAGMWIKFGDFEMIIPTNVAQAIKKHVMEKMVEKMTEEDGATDDADETDADEDAEEHEANESDETEAKEEHAFEETPAEEDAEEDEASETDEEEDDEETKKESVKLDLKKDAKETEKGKKKMCKKCMRKVEKSN